MAMTIATMGRRMKKRDMSRAPRSTRCGCGDTIVPSFNDGASSDDPVAGLQPFLDDPAVADALRRA